MKGPVMLIRRDFLAAAAALAASPAFAHHGWSSFDQGRPIYLEGKVLKSAWRNPHAELQLQLNADLKLPADLKARTPPAQSANVDGAAVLANAQLPKRKDAVWEVELAPLTRMQAWGVPEIKSGDTIALVGFTFAEEKGEPIVRVEYLFVGGKAYGLRSSPA